MAMDLTMSTDRDPGAAKPFTGRKMLICMVAFFAVIILANVIMMTFAVRTHTGVVVPNSYVASQDFNKKVEAARVQNAMGWRSEIAYAGGAVRLALTDKSGAPLRGLAVAGVVGRTVTDADDRPLAFHPLGPGVYRADADLGPGAWRAEILATTPSGAEYRQNFTLLVEAARK